MSSCLLHNNDRDSMSVTCRSKLLNDLNGSINHLSVLTLDFYMTETFTCLNVGVVDFSGKINTHT